MAGLAGSRQSCDTWDKLDHARLDNRESIWKTGEMGVSLDSYKHVPNYRAVRNC